MHEDKGRFFGGKVVVEEGQWSINDRVYTNCKTGQIWSASSHRPDNALSIKM